MQRVHRVGQGHVLPAQSRRTHVGPPQSAGQPFHRQGAGDRAHHHAVGAAFLGDQGGDATRGVAAGLGLGPVRVVDAHEHVGAGGRRLEDDELVAADAEMAVRHGGRAGGRDRQRGGARIQHDEVVAEAVHLAEGNHHAADMHRRAP